MQGMLMLFLAFQFTSCNDEPLVGEFPEAPSGAGTGQFVASVAGQQFVAESATGVLNDSVLLMSGMKLNGETIVLSIESAAEGTFDLGWDGSSSNFGQYLEEGTEPHPYVTTSGSGGSGELIITTLDNDAKLVSGTFSFVGVREKLDSSGLPILDDNGMPVMEEMRINNGSFNSIPFMALGGRNDNEN